MARCFLCRVETDSKCERCGLPACPAHLPSHTYQGECLPFTIESRPGKGNVVVATRDIRPSEVVLHDDAAVVGPNYETEAVCLECLGRVDGSVLCNLCNLPLCSEACQGGPNHLPECLVFRQLEPKMCVKVYGKGTIAPEYGCISVLRLLHLRDTDPGQWGSVQLLMDHDEDRRKEAEYWAMFQRNVVDFLRIKCGLAETYTEDEIHRAIGILRTNAFNIEHPHLAAQGTSGKAVCPTFSFLSHSCKSNGRYQLFPDNSLTIRAQVPIKAGEEITIQYITFLYGNSRRRKEIQECWFFQCTCERCEDPTELGSYVSAARCEDCGGTVLPAQPDFDYKTWSCSDCGAEMEAEQVAGVVRALENEMAMTEQHEFDKFQDMVDRYSKQLHTNNYQLQVCKRHLAGSIRGNLTLPKLEYRLKLMENFIQVFEAIDPGFTVWRGKMLYQVCKTRMFLADMKHAKDEMDKKTFLQEVRDNIAGMEEVEECLKYEPEDTNEFRIAGHAASSASQARELLNMMAVMESN